jgi:hypothetical protein
MACCLGGPRAQAETLYVVLPYFNFCGFKRRLNLFVEFVKQIEGSGVQVVIAEALGPAPLPDLKVFKHLKYETDSPVWLKENLINMAIARLPKGWKYVAWIDADISFLNPNWVRDTIAKLGTWDIVQMFQTCVNLGSKNEALKIDKGFGYMHRDSGTPYVKTDKYGYWHPGYAWACTRKAWLQMGGLIDWAILGSGDRHMSMAWIGRVKDSAPGNIHPNYRSWLEEYQCMCKGLKVSYVDGTILHHWHGRLEDRKYRERWDILTKNKFDPLNDIGQTSAGLIQLTNPGRRFEKDLLEYFVGRREDLV